jgi:hypothetical protein
VSPDLIISNFKQPRLYIDFLEITPILHLGGHVDYPALSRPFPHTINATFSVPPDRLLILAMAEQCSQSGRKETSAVV